MSQLPNDLSIRVAICTSIVVVDQLYHMRIECMGSMVYAGVVLYMREGGMEVERVWLCNRGSTQPVMGA